MLTLLSPAKNLNFDPAENRPGPTELLLAKDATELVKEVKAQSAADLKKLMHLSDNLAELNAERFKSFNAAHKSNSAKQAALAFNGDVYRGLNANSWSDDDLNYAQDHLRILSGLYGVLRPMDAMQPYRLEMGTRLPTKRGGNLYEFWGPAVADVLRDELSGHDEQTIVNLASNEYYKVVAKPFKSERVIDAKFLNVKDGKAKNISFFSKYARGLMAKWIVLNRIDNPSDLRDFDLDGYKFISGESTDETLVFSRKQPPPKK